MRDLPPSSLSVRITSTISTGICNMRFLFYIAGLGKRPHRPSGVKTISGERAHGQSGASMERPTLGSLFASSTSELY